VGDLCVCGVEKCVCRGDVHAAGQRRTRATSSSEPSSSSPCRSLSPALPPAAPPRARSFPPSLSSEGTCCAFSWPPAGPLWKSRAGGAAPSDPLAPRALLPSDAAPRSSSDGRRRFAAALMGWASGDRGGGACVAFGRCGWSERGSETSSSIIAGEPVLRHERGLGALARLTGGTRERPSIFERRPCLLAAELQAASRTAPWAPPGKSPKFHSSTCSAFFSGWCANTTTI